MTELYNSQLCNLGQMNKSSQFLGIIAPTFVVVVKIKWDTMYKCLLSSKNKQSFYASFHQHPDVQYCTITSVWLSWSSLALRSGNRDAMVNVPVPTFFWISGMPEAFVMQLWILFSPSGKWAQQKSAKRFPQVISWARSNALIS